MSGFEPRIVQPVDKSYYLLRYLSCFTPKLQIGGKPVGWVSDACLRKGETGISLVKHTHTVDPVSNKQSSKTKPLDCGSVPQVRTVSHMQSPSRIADPRVPKELLVLRTALHVSPRYHVYWLKLLTGTSIRLLIDLFIYKSDILCYYLLYNLWGNRDSEGSIATRLPGSILSRGKRILSSTAPPDGLSDASKPPSMDSRGSFTVVRSPEP